MIATWMITNTLRVEKVINSEMVSVYEFIWIRPFSKSINILPPVSSYVNIPPGLHGNFYFTACCQKKKRIPELCINSGYTLEE